MSAGDKTQSGLIAASEQGLISDAVFCLVAYSASNQINSVMREGDTIFIHFKSELIDESDPVPAAACVYEEALRTVIEQMDAARVLKNNADMSITIHGAKDPEAVVAQVKKELTKSIDAAIDKATGTSGAEVREAWAGPDWDKGLQGF